MLFKNLNESISVAYTKEKKHYIYKQINKKKQKNQLMILIIIVYKAENKKITMQQQGKTFSQEQFLRIKRYRKLFQ